TAQGEADASRGERVDCDGIVMSVGWMPNSSLLSQAGVRFTYDDAAHQLVPASMPLAVFVAGRANAVYDLSAQLADGRRAAAAAAQHLGASIPHQPDVP